MEGRRDGGMEGQRDGGTEGSDSLVSTSTDLMAAGPPPVSTGKGTSSVDCWNGHGL